MRIIRRQLWRAFPELDAFDDALCRAFVRTATASWRGKLFRLIVMGLLALTTLAIGLLVGQTLDDALPQFTPAYLVYPLVGLALASTLLIGFAFTYLVRDYMLRRRVRRVIHGRGACANCRYPLLGMPVSAELIIRCPECGHATFVDAAMGELAPGDRGTGVFQPVAPRLDERGRRRRRRFVRITAIGSVAVVLLASAAYGTAWLYLLWQAGVAKGQRDGANQMRLLIASHQPIPGARVSNPLPTGLSLQELEARNRWTEVEALLEQVRVFSREFPKKHEWPAGVEEHLRVVEYSAVWPLDPDQSRPFRPNELEGRALERSGAIAALHEARRTSLLDDLQRLREIDVAMRPVGAGVQAADPQPPPLILETSGVRASARLLAQMSTARMYLAVEQREPAEYIEALDEALSVALVMEAQAGIWYLQTANAIQFMILTRVAEDARVIQDSDWLARVQACIIARSSTVTTTAAIDHAKIVALDTVNWFFAQPGRVHQGWTHNFMEGLDNDNLRGRWTGTAPIGSHYANLIEIETQWRIHRAHHALPPPARTSPLGPKTGPRLRVPVAQFGYFVNIVPYPDSAAALRSGTLTLLGIRRYELRTGLLPATLNELSPEDLSTKAIDPFSGGAFGYKLIDPATTPGGGGRRFLLYSVGIDGKDDGGVISPKGARWPLSRNWPGADAIINPPEDTPPVQAPTMDPDDNPDVTPESM